RQAAADSGPPPVSIEASSGYTSRSHGTKNPTARLCRGNQPAPAVCPPDLSSRTRTPVCPAVPFAHRCVPRSIFGSFETRRRVGRLAVEILASRGCCVLL